MGQFTREDKDLSARIEVSSKDEISEVAVAFNNMAQALEEQTERERHLNSINQEQT
jgi:two-component system chemotaxis sensor kinase CheA